MRPERRRAGAARRAADDDRGGLERSDVASRHRHDEIGLVLRVGTVPMDIVGDVTMSVMAALRGPIDDASIMVTGVAAIDRRIRISAWPNRRHAMGGFNPAT